MDLAVHRRVKARQSFIFSAQPVVVLLYFTPVARFVTQGIFSFTAIAPKTFQQCSMPRFSKRYLEANWMIWAFLGWVKSCSKHSISAFDFSFNVQWRVPQHYHHLQFWTFGSTLQLQAFFSEPVWSKLSFGLKSAGSFATYAPKQSIP